VHYDFVFKFNSITAVQEYGCCISHIGLSNEMSQISTPHSWVTAQPMLMKLETYSYSWKTTHLAKRHFHRTTWVVWMNTQFTTVGFLSLSFFGLIVTHTGHTGGPILTICTSYEIFPLKDCLLVVLLTPI